MNIGVALCGVVPAIHSSFLYTQLTYDLQPEEAYLRIFLMYCIYGIGMVYLSHPLHKLPSSYPPFLYLKDLFFISLAILRVNIRASLTTWYPSPLLTLSSPITTNLIVNTQCSSIATKYGTCLYWLALSCIGQPVSLSTINGRT